MFKFGRLSSPVPTVATGLV